MRRSSFALGTLAVVAACGGPAIESSNPPDDTDSEPTISPAAQELAFQVPGRDFRAAPPKIRSMALFRDRLAAPGEIRLDVRYAEAFPARIQFSYEGSLKTLRDDGQHPDRVAGDGTYSVLVPEPQSMVFPAPGGATQDLGRALAELPNDGTRGLELPVYPSWTAGMDAHPEALAIPPPSDPEKSLLVRDLSVVNNSSRTHDPCLSTSASDANKKWTMGYLLTQMANQSVTGKSPSQFATAWLKEWRANSRTVNSDVVHPIPSPTHRKTADEALRQWRCRSNMTSCCVVMPTDTEGAILTTSSQYIACENEAATKSLAMNKAPFRLLAIVNRLDLRKNRFFGEGAAGELRFVFGLLDLDQRETSGGPCAGRGIIDVTRPINGNPPGPGAGQPGGITTVILEYAVDKSSSAAVKTYAQQWYDLSDLSFGTTYRDRLQTLTESVVRAGVGAPFGRRNGSALARIRTNESGDDARWQMREFTITSTNELRPATIKQTPSRAYADPHASINISLANWINDHELDVLEERHNVPSTLNGLGLLGGETIPGDNQHWQFAGNVNNPEARHKFSINTCNGCHGGREGPPMPFAHIQPRVSNEVSILSGFLTGDEATDPEDQTTVRFFNALQDRNLDLIELVFATPLAAMSVQPSSRTH